MYVAWAEDRALLKSNPSADPGAKIGDGAATSSPHLLSSLSEIGIKALNFRGRMPRLVRHDVVCAALAYQIIYSIQPVMLGIRHMSSDWLAYAK